MKISTRFVSAVAASLMASTAAVAGSADSSADVVESTYTVRIVRSELSTPEGAKAAYTALRAAARRACDLGEPLMDAGMFQSLADERRCVESALDAAVKQLGSPAVSQLHGAPMQVASN